MSSAEGWLYILETMTGNHQNGPVADKDLADLARRGKIKASTLLMHPSKSRGGWVAAEQIPALKAIFEEKAKALIPAPKPADVVSEVVAPKEAVISRFLSDGQDQRIVAKLYEKLQHILTPQEQLNYIAHQKSPHILAPDCFALTSTRFIRFQGSMLGGFQFVDFLWIYLSNAHYSEGVLYATVTMQVSNGQTLELNYVPKQQARAMYQLCQQAELVAFEQRRARWAEDQRILNPQSQHNITVNAGPSDQSSAGDPVERLGKLKKMLDAGLISQAEFDETKAKILASL